MKGFGGKLLVSKVAFTEARATTDADKQVGVLCGRQETKTKGTNILSSQHRSPMACPPTSSHKDLSSKDSTTSRQFQSFQMEFQAIPLWALI